MKLDLDSGYLLFVVDCLGCALRLNIIDRIINFSNFEIIPIPGNKSYIEGVTEYNRRVLPIFNLKKWLNLQENVYNDREWVIIILKLEKDHYGLLVDSVVAISDPQMLQKSSDDKINEMFLPVDKKWISEVIHVSDHPFVIFELENLLLEKD